MATLLGVRSDNDGPKQNLVRQEGSQSRSARIRWCHEFDSSGC